MEIMLEYEYMRLEKEGKLAWLTFTRENQLNAMNNACIDQINRIAMTLKEDSDARVVIIRGEGRAFSTGIDLKELAADRIEMDYHHRWEQALRLFETMEKLVIVGMHGYCLGGALQLALAADIRVGTAECQIGLPAIKESLIPGLATSAAAPLYRLGTCQKDDSGRAKYRRPGGAADRSGGPHSPRREFFLSSRRDCRRLPRSLFAGNAYEQTGDQSGFRHRL